MHSFLSLMLIKIRSLIIADLDTQITSLSLYVAGFRRKKNNTSSTVLRYYGSSLEVTYKI